MTYRARWRKGSVQKVWNEAEEGPTGGRLCPACEKEVKVAPGSGYRDWDMDHHPEPWSLRDFPDDVTRKEVFNNYQEGVILKCQTCNRREGNRK